MKRLHIPLSTAGAQALVSVCAVIVLASCQSRQIDNSNPFETNGPVSYAADIMPLVSTACSGSGCHIGETTSGVNMSNRAAMLASVGEQYAKNVVIPGNAGGSPLIDKLFINPDFGVRMPRGRGPLSESEINRITEWIDDGALNN